MNYFILIVRLFLVLYGAFLLLFAVGEGITGEGFPYVLPPMFIILILVFLWNKPIWSAVCTMILFGVSIWFFGTYDDLVPFLIISLPLLVAGILFIWDQSKTKP
jgi:hypothetical protein